MSLKKDLETMPEQKTMLPFKEGEQYITLLQENITRMATNSATCKNWLMVIIAGALAIVFSSNTTSEQVNMLLCVLEVFTVLLFLLDCFYLGIERRMRDAEKMFVKMCKDGNDEDAKTLWMSFSKSLIIDEKFPDTCKEPIKKIKGQIKDTICGMWSLSTTPFYGAIFIVLWHIGN